MRIYNAVMAKFFMMIILLLNVSAKYHYQKLRNGIIDERSLKVDRILCVGLHSRLSYCNFMNTCKNSKRQELHNLAARFGCNVK